MTKTEAEIKIGHLYRNGGSADQIRDAQADRAEAMGDTLKAAQFRLDAQLIREHGTDGWLAIPLSERTVIA